MTKKYIFTVHFQQDNISQRLDNYLSQEMKFQSRSQIQNLIKKNQIKVNGEIKKSSFLIKNDDEIAIELSEDFSLIIQPENIALDIVFEDDSMLVVNKPKNMLTHPTTKEIENTLVNALLYRYGYEGLSDINGVMRPGIIHRLDRNTSGLLMIAKTNEAHKYLTEQIRTKSAARKYLAVVKGNFENLEGTINQPIGRNSKEPQKMAVIEGAKPSVTHYRVLEQFKGFSFIELMLETGRTHQIRVHMSYISHPIVNDSLYNKEPIKVKTQEQVLQAYALQFKSLMQNDIINLEIKPDHDIEKVLKFLRSSKK